jgi:precorrin-2 dehydrogenase/sirohydrochlorin ferrochelatase
VRYLPIELDVLERDALVVGATGEVIAKIDRLLEAGARVTVVAEGVHAEIEKRAKDGHISLLRRALCDGDLEGKAIVFVAPGDEAISRSLHDWAARTGRLVCTLDRPEVSTFVNPAVIAASNFTMSFSSGGTSPGTLRRIREDLSALFSDERFGRYLSALSAFREKLPRGERAARMSGAVQGFGIEARLRFPAWFERGEAPGEAKPPAGEEP